MHVLTASRRKKVAGSKWGARDYLNLGTYGSTAILRAICLGIFMVALMIDNVVDIGLSCYKRLCRGLYIKWY